jgi:nicotinate-nucleotide pyrophosphorylase (carboxylating)
MKVIPFGALDPGVYRELVRRAVAEDLGWGDITTNATIDTHQRARGTLVAKAPCVLAGIAIAEETFRQLDPVVVFEGFKRDGDLCEPGDVVAEVTGFASALLTGERTALNFLQRLSGIATLTRRFVDASGGRITILDTRKTTPTLRELEKYAVRAGGGVNHRHALDDGVLIKDNHIRLAGGIKEALARMRETKPEMSIEVEVQSLDEIAEALSGEADIILLDNMTPDQVREAVRRVGGRAKIEISGGVTLDRMPALAASGAEYVSIGALTHSAPAVDQSFEIEPV